MKRSAADFVHLHNHSQYSLLDGALRIEEMVKLAAQYGMPALAITDHGNMCGAIEFYKAAQEAGVKPIVGAELYIAPGDRKERKVHAEIPESSFHLTLLVQDETGYYNLMKLATLGYLEGFYYRPRIDKELLAQHGKGLVALSGCLKGEVNWFLRRGETEKAMRAAAQYQEIMGQENFFLEVMRAGVDEQERIIPGVGELSESLGIPVVATNDCHYLRPEDHRAHEVLVCIQTGKKLSDASRMRMTTDQLFFRSPQEMQRLFADIPGAVERTKEIADRCNLRLDFDRVRLNLPRYKSPEGYADDFAYLKHQAQEGLKRRYHRTTAAVEERLAHELDVIRQMGFPGYFLIVKDIVDFARSKGIPVGPGRGSAAGCLVLYCLDITDIDPLRYGLLFERFLTLERVSMPDVDIDFSDTRRQEIIDYIRQRYGEDSVAQIITFGTMQARAVVRDVGRVMDVPIPEVDRMAKLIPAGLSLAEALTQVAEFKAMVESKAEYHELVVIARKLEGLNRHASIHASAVVIAPRPLLELVPLYRTPEGDVCTQYDMYSLESVGLLKLDVLGLRTLTVVQEAQRLVKESGHRFSLEELTLEDAKTYHLLQRGDTVGVFQLESSGMRDLCRRMLPESIEHIIALIALYRPGPMKLLDTFVGRKAGHEKIEYEHSLLEPICRETYGVMIYQEQVMQAAQALAGYNLGKADLLRRAMGKKNPTEMEALRQTFIDGCQRYNRIPEDKAERIFNLLAKFAGYGFNKSHAAGYAYLSYITAFLKANYPVEFIAATLTSELGDSKKLAKFVGEARRMGIEVLGPDVNRSQTSFSIEQGTGARFDENQDRQVKGQRPKAKAQIGNRKSEIENRRGAATVRFGLAGIRNLGMGASERIVEERQKNGQYESPLDFLTRNRGVVNRKAAESLVKAGAFDWTGENRAALLSGLELEIARAGSEKLRFAELQADLFGTTVRDEAPKPERKLETRELLSFEKDAFGFYFSSHPLEPYRHEYRALKLASTGQLDEKEDNDGISLAGVITGRRVKRDKNDREYVQVTLEDFEGWVEVMVFSGQLEQCRQHLMTDSLVVVQGRVRRREGSVAQIWADRVTPMQEVSRFLQALTLELGPDVSDDLALLKLRELLREYPGSSIVYLKLRHKDGGVNVLRVKEYKVSIGNELVTELVRRFGDSALELHGALPAPEAGPGYRGGRLFPRNSKKPAGRG